MSSQRRGAQESKAEKWVAALAGVAALGLGGCHADVRPRTAVAVPAEPEVELVATPLEVETYPFVMYRGTRAYYVEGNWYYRGPRGWVVYRREPVELARYRVAMRFGAQSARY
jgi:hypothetical protein